MKCLETRSEFKYSQWVSRRRLEVGALLPGEFNEGSWAEKLCFAWGFLTGVQEGSKSTQAGERVWVGVGRRHGDGEQQGWPETLADGKGKLQEHQGAIGGF